MALANTDFVQLTKCSRCELLLTAASFNARADRPSGLHTWCRECQKQYGQAYRGKNQAKLSMATARWKQENRPRVREGERNAGLRIKLEVFAMFGSVCARCGFADVRALQIDHISQATERRGERFRCGLSLYRAIRRGERATDDLQLLCANCNWIKREEADEVPRAD